MVCWGGGGRRQKQGIAPTASRPWYPPSICPLAQHTVDSPSLPQQRPRRGLGSSYFRTSAAFVLRTSKLTQARLRQGHRAVSRPSPDPTTPAATGAAKRSRTVTAACAGAPLRMEECRRGVRPPAKRGRCGGGSDVCGSGGVGGGPVAHHKNNVDTPHPAAARDYVAALRRQHGPLRWSQAPSRAPLPFPAVVMGNHTTVLPAAPPRPLAARWRH